MVIDLLEAVEPFVDYYRVIAGEHPDWEEYRRAMVEQGKCLIRITPRRWGPLATGAFPRHNPPRGRVDTVHRLFIASDHDSTATGGFSPVPIHGLNR